MANKYLTVLLLILAVTYSCSITNTNHLSPQFSSLEIKELSLFRKNFDDKLQRIYEDNLESNYNKFIVDFNNELSQNHSLFSIYSKTEKISQLKILSKSCCEKIFANCDYKLSGNVANIPFNLKGEYFEALQNYGNKYEYINNYVDYTLNIGNPQGLDGLLYLFSRNPEHFNEIDRMIISIHYFVLSTFYDQK